MSALVLPFVVFVILLVAIVAFIDSRSDVKKKKVKGLNIPPGNMGWPLIGETIAFRSLHSSTALGPYMEQHKRRYGSIYRSHLFGAPTIVSADPEFNRFILLNDGKLFEPSWPRSVAAILGETSMLVATGELHRYMKAMSVNFMGVPRLREYFMGALEGFVQQAFSSWKENTPFSAKEQACSVTFNLMVKNILSLNPGEADTELLRKEYTSFMKGVVSFPLNLPGTAYRKALQARDSIFKVIERLREVRIKEQMEGRDQIGDADLLGFVLSQSNLSVLQICDLLLGLLFGGHETTATAITLSIYFLEACPKAVQHLREEFLQIRAMKKQKGETTLNWDDYKQMEFTQCVISETLRLGNVIRFVHRKATTNVHYKGYDIPEGWSVVPVFAAAHLDESAYESPGRFDPWRWQTFTGKPDNYMPFGQGLRNCAGLELAKMEMAVFLYHLVLNYDWELAEPDYPLSYAFPEFPKGLPIKVRAFSHDK